MRALKRCLLFLVLAALLLPAGSPLVEDSFELILLPDTQFYSSQLNGGLPSMFYAQTAWIASQAPQRNIKAVLGLGDIVECGSSPAEWSIAQGAYATLDGAGVPYLLAVGNHDYDASCGDLAGRATATFDANFGVNRFTTYPWYGAGNYPPASDANSFIKFDAAGRKYLALALEFFPRDAALQWAQQVISANPDREVILVTHAYLRGEGKRFQESSPDNDGQEIWDKLVRTNFNVVAVVNGHFTGPGVARRSDKGINNNVVAQMLSNYQADTNGGNGYLRILKFYPNLDRIDVTTYSPYLNSYLTDTGNQFSINYKVGRRPRK